MGDLNGQIIFNQIDITNHIMVVTMSHNRSGRHCSHYSIIKFIDFEPIYYVIKSQFGVAS